MTSLNGVRAGRRLSRLMITGCFAATLVASPLAAAEPAGRAPYEQLAPIYADLQKWRSASLSPLSTDFRPAAVAQRKAQLRALQVRLEDMSVAGWTVPQKVDWLAVRSRLDEVDFIYRVTKPWTRDPGFFTSEMQSAAFTNLPAKGPELEKLRASLRNIPAVLAQARLTLNDVAGDHADLAISALTNSDGVEDGYPHRDKMPAGVIGWYKDLLGRAQTAQPELAPDIRNAIGELDAFRQWLVDNRPQMNRRAGVGEKAFDWYIANVLLMPYTSQEVVSLSQRELERLWGFYALERHRNAALPELKLAKSKGEYEQLLAETDARIRKFLIERQFMTIPAVIPADWRKHVVPPEYLEPFNVPYSLRNPPNYWEQIQFRDPSPDHLHAVIPGHRFDNKVAQSISNPIRRGIKDGGRWQGWAVYLEEAALQTGFFDDRPRVRELIYSFGLWRAARTIGDARNQLNELNSAQVVDYWLGVTPLLDRNVARKYAHIRTTPGHGMEYTMGNMQMWALLADAKKKAGDKFVLKTFHDEIIMKGRIPLSLVRYEMTGYDKDVKAFFNRAPMPAAD